MGRKRIQLLCISLICLIFFVSCSGNGMEAAKVLTDGKQVLNIFCMATVHDNDPSLLKAINLFNTITNNTYIRVKEFQDREAWRNDISIGILAGDGPDIIVGDDIFPALGKVISGGAFCDLNGLIAEDKEFKLSDYPSSIMDCGIVDGKRYIIPLEYLIDCFYTTKQFLNQNNLNFEDSSWTWKEFAEIAQKFAEENIGKDKYLLGSNFGIQMLMESWGVDFIDYSGRKSRFDSPEFIELLKTYKEIYPAVRKKSYKGRLDFTTLSGYSDYEPFIHGKDVMISGVLRLNTIWSFNCMTEGLINSKLEVLRLPTCKPGSKMVARPWKYAGINNTCKNKAQAFEFIKQLLLKKEGVIYSMGIHINRSSFEGELKQNMDCLHSADGSECYEGSTYSMNGKEWVRWVDTTQTQADQANRIVVSVGKAEILDSEVIDMINNELPDFLNERKSSIEAAKNIQEKVMLFLNE